MPHSVTVIYHADCPDGFGAAFAAWKKFGAAARYCPMHHGEDWQTLGLAEQTVYILDFSFPRTTLERIAADAGAVIQIDHHASARTPWTDLLRRDGEAAEHYRHPDLPLDVIFDLNKSGVRLAWEHFFPDTPLPLPLAHIEDGDLWRFALPGSRAFGRALRLLPFDFAVWDELLGSAASPEAPRYRALLVEGQAIEQFFQREVARLADSRLVMPARLRGAPLDPLQAVRHGLPLLSAENQSWQAVGGLAINADSLFASELGNTLAERSGTFGLTWQLSADGEVKASLRAAGKVNVAEIAGRYGGGGHPNAAGFRMALAQFMAEVVGFKSGLPTD